MSTLHEGFLHKQGHRRKNWKRRYFVLTNDALRYYTTEAGGQLKGELIFASFNCQGCKVKQVDAVLNLKGTRGLSEFVIMEDKPLEHQYDKRLLLLAGSEEDRADWIAAITPLKVGSIMLQPLFCSR